MNFQPVTMREGQTIQCSQCYRMNCPIWADLDGPAYAAYCCVGCYTERFITSRQEAYNKWRLAAEIFGEHSLEADAAAGAYVQADKTERETIKQLVQDTLHPSKSV